MISIDDYKLDDNAVVGGVVWKSVNMDVFSDFYEVNDYGAVRSLHPLNYHRLMTPQEDKDGYLRYIFRVHGYTKHPHAQRLVALTFIPNFDALPQVDHIDGNKRNNNVSNLRWVTCKENVNNPITLQVRRDTLAKLKITEEYREIKRKSCKKAAIIKGYHVVCLETGKWYNSALDASKDFNIDVSAVLRSCKRYEKQVPQRFKEYLGRVVYHFRYATEEENAINVPIYREALLKSLGE